MLDIRFVRENAELVQDNAKKKGYDINVQQILELDAARRQQQLRVEELRERRNSIASQMNGGRPSDDLIAEGKQIKDQLAELEPALREADETFMAQFAALPNMLATDVPLGGEEDSVEVRQWGEQTGGEGVIDHLEFAEKRDWVDFERGAKVAGAKFYFLKGDGALLENAITQFALQFLISRGFTFMTVPHAVNSRVAMGTGFVPRSDAQSDQYFIEGEDLSLIATAEMPLTGYHADEILNETDLPLFYAGLSPSYRKEAGTYGKHTRGLFRVHQFNKLEMYAFTTPEQSVEVHQKLLGFEEELWQALGIPYHVINIAAGDLGAPAAKKYDLEYWSPVDQTYRELTSCSNCTDFQARNLNIRVRRDDGTIDTVHTLNGTAVSLARSIIAVIEHYQNVDGTLRVPEVLKPYLGGKDTL